MSQELTNLAELTTITIDKHELQSAWNSFVDENSNQLDWGFRVMIDYNHLSYYFKNLLGSILEVVDAKPKNYMFQVFDKRLYDKKYQLNIVHKDVDRLSCITIPLTYNVMEPVMFYKDIPDINPEEYKKTGRPWPEKPIQIARYSDKHPTLVNVNNLHNVRVLEEISPRVLLQISFDCSFDNIIDKNPTIWRVI